MDVLVITADDYGYAPGYDAGIVEAAAAAAVDAVSVMVGEGRRPDPAPLVETGVAIGIHLELPSEWPRERERRREAVADSLEEHWERFEDVFGRPPAHLDGHLHCHAAPQVAVPVARFARERELPLRAVSARHARLVRCLGASAPDRIIGRMAEDEGPRPAEITAVLEGGEAPAGISEWVVHPGHPDAGAGSSYDAGRAEDLELVLSLAGSPELRLRRASHAVALSPASSAR